MPPLAATAAAAAMSTVSRSQPVITTLPKSFSSDSVPPLRRSSVSRNSVPLAGRAAGSVRVSRGAVPSRSGIRRQPSSSPGSGKRMQAADKASTATSGESISADFLIVRPSRRKKRFYYTPKPTRSDR